MTTKSKSKQVVKSRVGSLKKRPSKHFAELGTKVGYARIHLRACS